MTEELPRVEASILIEGRLIEELFTLRDGLNPCRFVLFHEGGEGLHDDGEQGGYRLG